MNYAYLEAATAAKEAQLLFDQSEKERSVIQQEKISLTGNIRYLQEAWSRIDYRFGSSAVGAISPLELMGNENIVSLAIFELIDGKYFPKDEVVVLDNSDSVFCLMSKSGICHFLKMTESAEGITTWSKSTRAEMFREQAQVMLLCDNPYCRTSNYIDFSPNDSEQEDIIQELRIQAKQKAIMNEAIAANPVINIDMFKAAFGGSIIAQKGKAWAIKTRNLVTDLRDSCTTMYYTLDGMELCYFSADAYDSTNTWNWFSGKEYDLIKQINELV
jgi:hypothetical protein